MSDSIPNFPELEGRYEIHESIGEGRFATVFRATDRELSRDIAIKWGRLAGRSQDEILRMRRELRVSCRLRHPHIAGAIDGIDDDESVLLFLPFCSGGTIPVNACEGKPLRMRVRQLQQIGSAVHYLHQRKLAHGDIKPENILIDGRGNALLADLGSCHSLSTAAPDDSNLVAGTAAYLAPELAAGETDSNTATDIYALGVTLFAVTTGQAPYSGDAHSIIEEIRNGHSIEARLPSGYDPDLKAIISHACARVPEERYRDAAEFSKDLHAWLTGQPLIANPPSFAKRATLWVGQNRLAAGLITGILVFLIVGTMVSLTVWIQSQNQLLKLARSQTQLKQQGAEAKQRESELSNLLSAIEADRDVIEASLEEETRLEKEAQAFADQARQKLATAQANLKRANELAAQINSVSMEQQGSQEVLEFLQFRAAQQDSYEFQLVLHQDLSDALTEAKNTRRHTSITDLPISSDLKGFAVGHALVPHTQRDLRTRTHSIQLRGKPHRLVWDRSQNQMAVSGDFPGVMLLERQSKTTRQGAEKWNSNAIPLNSVKSPSNRLLGFSQDSVQAETIAIADREGNAGWNVSVWDIPSRKRIANYQLPELIGEVFAVHCADADSIALFCREPATSDLVWLDVASKKRLWSCRQERESLSLPNDGPVYPFFLDAGADPATGWLLLSANKPDSLGLSEIVLHGMTNRLWESDSKPPLYAEKPLYVGKQAVSQWRSKIQVLPNMILASGKHRPSTNFPSQLADRSHQLGEFLPLESWETSGLSVYSNGQWRSLADASSLGTLKYFPLGTTDGPNGFDRTQKPLCHPSLDLATGQVRFLSRNGRVHIVDLLLGETIWETLSVPYLAESEHVVWSPSGHQIVISSGDALQITTFFRRSNASFPNTVAGIMQGISGVLESKPIPDRLKESIAAASASSATSSLKDSPASDAANRSGLNPKNPTSTDSSAAKSMDPVMQPGSLKLGKYALRFYKRDEKVTIKDVSLPIDKPMTYEVVVRLNSLSRVSYSPIVRHENFILRRFQENGLEFRVCLDSKAGRGKGFLVLIAKSYPKKDWMHLAATWDGQTARIFIDGILQAEKTAESEIRTTRHWGPVELGGTSSDLCEGDCDSFRLSRSCLYAKDFDPPATLTKQSDTVALFDLEEGQGKDIKWESSNDLSVGVYEPHWVKTTDPIDRPNNPVSYQTLNLEKVESPDKAIGLSQAPSISRDKFWSDNSNHTIEFLMRLHQKPSKHNAAICIVNGTQVILRNDGRVYYERPGSARAMSHRLPRNTWIHIACVFDRKTMRLFVNGVETSSSKLRQYSIDEKAGWMGGMMLNTYKNRPAMIDLANLRISNVARYDQDFELQSVEVDSDTYALYRFDEGQGKTFHDSGPRELHINVDWDPSWVDVSQAN